ncbi:MAG: L-rhamnose isomerase [Oscillospiraceae bacterium]|nr:L-rhamnose isomerase [Oscillospiraceae bacterium]
MQKSLLNALLMPHEAMREVQESGDMTGLMVMQE